MKKKIPLHQQIFNTINCGWTGKEGGTACV